MARYLLAHDLGTSGNKATLYTTDGRLVKSMVYGYETDYFNGNWAEQDAENWWKAVCTTTRQILEGVDCRQVAAVSFSGQMNGCLCVDAYGKPLRKSIIWADQRAVKEVDSFREKIDEYEFYRITGQRMSPSISMMKLLWLKNNEPGIYRNTFKMLNAKDYIVLKLTGKFVTDYSDASGTGLLDLNTLKWSDRLLGLSGIDGDKLPELKASTAVAGVVTKGASDKTGLAEGTPVVCGGGDGVCASVGSGCIKEGIAYNAVGSSSWISLTTKEPIFDEKMRTFNFAHIIPGYIAPCGAMQSAGLSYSWLKNEICTSEVQEAEKLGISPYEIINRKIEKSPVGANGIIFLPYLLGERSPRWNSDAKGAFIGLKMEHKREDILRAVIEGITFNLNIILNIFKNYTGINEMIVIGGGAKGKVWRQMMADMYGMKVLKPNFLEEATSMGAAITAGVGVGEFEGFDAINRFIEIESIEEPIEANTRKYAERMPVFDECYESLLKVFGRL